MALTKTATVSIARLDSTAAYGRDVVGSVSLKYVHSPSPINLTSPEGLKDLAARLYSSWNASVWSLRRQPLPPPLVPA